MKTSKTEYVALIVWFLGAALLLLSSWKDVIIYAVEERGRVKQWFSKRRENRKRKGFFQVR